MTETPAVLKGFALSPEQREAALTRGRDVVVTAGAGTGKTRTLVARYLALLAGGLPLRGIAAVTFTRKAAREMRNRVRGEIGIYLAGAELSREQRERWERLNNELDAARIGTIHNLCADILRAHPAEAGLDPRFNVLDETQTALLVQETAEAALAWSVGADGLEPLFELLRERALLDLIRLLLKQRLDVQEVLAGPASGDILTYWRERLEGEQATALAAILAKADFQAAVQVLRFNQATSPGDLCEIQRAAALAALTFPEDAGLAERLGRLVALDAINLRGGSQRKWPGGKEQLVAVKEALEKLRGAYRGQKILTLGLNEQDAVIANAMPAIAALFDYAQDLYRARQAEREALDFDDLEALAIELLEGHDDVRAYWQEQIQAVLVDEFQDTNERQRRFIRLLSSEAGELFIVGDAKQSIYRFRGADVAVFDSEKSRIQEQGGKHIPLDTSYRAHEALLEGMNQLLGPVLGPDDPGRPPWEAPFARLEAGTRGIEHDLAPPFVEFHLALGRKVDALPLAARALAARLAQLHREQGLDYGEMAILCRSSNAFSFYENALDAAGIPYLTVAGKGFYDRPEIRDLLNALAAIADPHDDLALAGLLRSPACGLSDVSLYRLVRGRPEGLTLWVWLPEAVLEDAAEAARLRRAVELVRDLSGLAGRVPAADLFKDFLDRTHYRAILRLLGQPRALRNVAKLLADIHNSELVSAAAFLEYAQTSRDSGSREGEARATGGGAVQIMTIHTAKGLEFPLVVLGDAGFTSRWRGGFLIDRDLGVLLPQKGIVDHNGIAGSADKEIQATSYELGKMRLQAREEAETARLLYVALTRAEQLLLISGAGGYRGGRIAWNGWLGQLAAITGLAGADLDAYDHEGSRRHIVDLVLQETAIRATVYEPGYEPAVEVPPPAAAVVAVGPERPALQEPLMKPDRPAAVDGETEEKTDKERPQRVWQVVPTAKRPGAPAWLVGSIVHEALALWRFPGSDPGFQAWATARAKEYGLTDPQQWHNAFVEIGRLLRRFQAHPLYRQIEEAERRLHEVPYSYQRSGQTESGYIDLLYMDNGTWTVIDFKTDRVRDEAGLQRLLAEKDYRVQLRGYGTAVGELLGVRPKLLLCFLNVGNQVWLENESEVH